MFKLLLTIVTNLLKVVISVVLKSLNCSRTYIMPLVDDITGEEMEHGDKGFGWE